MKAIVKVCCSSKRFQKKNLQWSLQYLGQLLDLDEFDVEYQYRVRWNASRHTLGTISHVLKTFFKEKVRQINRV